jgi:hypothetical protein
MKIAYSVATINYLWQAENMVQSFLKHNPDYHFFVCIVDMPPADWHEKNYEFSFQIIWIEQMQIDALPKMIEYYNVFELVMATKAFGADFLLKKYQPAFLVYLDGDMLVFNTLEWLEMQFQNHSILLTAHCHQPPHYLTPLEKVRTSLEQKNLYEDRVFLLLGLYNAGFFAVKNDKQGQEFIAWWKIRLQNQCYSARYAGLFADQMWLNLVPIYFDKTLIIKHLGYNVGCWSFHERSLISKDKIFYVNGEFPLVIFHYTGYRHTHPQEISEWIPLTIAERPDMKPVFDLYQQTFDADKYPELKQVRCVFAAQHAAAQAAKKVFVKESIDVRIGRKLISFLPDFLQKKIKKIACDC